MNMSKRNSYDKNFKAKIALEALKGERTIAEIASEHGIHPNQITQWKQQLLEGLPEIFERKKSKGPASEDDRERDELYRQIGKMKIEIDWLKKKLDPFFR